MAVDPNDPNAAQPGKPASAAPAPSSPANEPGTLSDTVERYGSPLSTTPITQPLDKEQSWGEWLAGGWDHFSAKVDAGETLQLGDNSLGYTNALRKGYKPIVEMLGGDPLKDNPGHYDVSKWADPEIGHFLTGDLRSREDQEQRLAEQIRARRLKEPGFAPGVPDDPKKLRAYVMAADTKEREAAQATIAQGGGGLGTLAAQGYGSFKGSLADPAVISTFPIGGGGKTLLQVVGREALVNGAIAAAALPGEARNRDDRGEAPLTFGEGAAQVAGGALLGSVIGAGVHGAGKALEATGLPQKLASTIGNLDIANTVSYKIYSALPERLQNKWGAGIVTKWAHRLAAGEKLEDVFSNLSNVELATLSRTVVGEPHLSPEERAAAEHLTRNEEIGDASPYEAGPTGDAKHEEQLGGAVDSIINGKPVEENPSAPLTGSDATGSPDAPARPPAALSTAERPLRFAIAHNLPMDIVDGLKARGIPDHIARGAAAGAFAESGGRLDAVNRKSGAMGFGQWLGSRKDELIRRYGPNPTHEQQLDFLAWELKGGDHGGKSVLAARDEVEALHRYIKDFMRPAAGYETDRDLRTGMAALGRKADELGDLHSFTSPIAAGGAELEPDPEVARLREEAANLDDAVIGLSEKPDGSSVNAYGRRVAARDILVDADRFQFKAGGDEHGVTDRLQGVQQWDAVASGRVALWEDRDGRLWVANGHQRTGLARRLEEAGHPPITLDAAVWREADGVTADDAMVMAALHNMGEDSGTVIDAAKIGRHNAEALERAAKRLPPKSALVRDARALTQLSDEAFGHVYRGSLAPDFAAVIGHLLPDHPEQHGAIAELLMKIDPANRGQAESIVRQAIAAGMHKSEQTDLFGTRETMQSLMLERAKVLERGLTELNKSKLLFNTAAKEADTLEAVGSKIAKSASEKEAQANAQALELVRRLAFTHGPIADALNAAAAKLAAGAKLTDVAAEFARSVKTLDLGAVSRAAPVDDSSRLLDDGAGRGRDAGEAGEAVQDEQPSLLDLEGATKRFSDPDGPAVKHQAESLFHDFKAAIDAESIALGEEDFAHLSDREVAEQLVEEVIDEAINNQAIKAGRELTLPEAGGPHDLDNPEYEALRSELADLAEGPLAGEREKLVARAEKAIKDGRLTLQDHGEPKNIGPNPDGMEPSDIVLPPANPKKSASYAGPELPPEEAAAKVASWKEEAKRIGAESPPPPGTTILSLFDDSGTWSKPYREMGYEVIQLDIKHGHDLLQNIGHYINAIREFKAKGGKIAGVLAQPPCTTFAGSGARWWDERHNRNWANAVEKMWGSWAAKMFDSPVEYNQFLVSATEEFIRHAAPDFFAMENPRGRIAKLNGLPKANLEIEPHHFGDPYTKNTFLYGTFNNELPTANVHPAEGSRVHKLRSRDEKEEGLRSLTPEGFAYAFALANRPGTEAADRAAGVAAPSSAAEPLSRRDQIKAATAELDKAKPGEFRTIEPFKAEEPGYHRFRYVAPDGKAVGGNYTLDGNTIEGFNIGDVHNPVDLGPAQMRHLAEQIHAEHPEVQYVQAYRKSGARTHAGAGEQEIWLELTDNGIRFHKEDPRPLVDHRSDVTRFASGMSRKGDLAAGTYALGESDKMGVGVEVGELSDPGIDQIAHAVVNWKTDVFVDSGAFGAFRKKLRDGTAKPIDFDKVLARYDAIEQRIHDANPAEIPASDRGRLLLVMPDVVGDQKASLELLRHYADHVRTHVAFQGGGTIPIVPLQKGELSIGEAFNEAKKILGRDDFVVGIPSNEAALSADEFRQFLKEAKPKGIHFLGAASEKTLGPKIDVLNEVARTHGLKLEHLTADANLLRSKLYGRSDVTGEARPTAVMETLRKEDLALGSKSAQQYAADSAELAARKAAKPAPLRVADRATEDLAFNPPGEADANPASLDLGEKVDPAIAERQRHELELRANSPLRPEGIDRVAAEDMAASFRLDEEGGEITAKDLLAELEADDKAIAAMKGCL